MVKSMTLTDFQVFPVEMDFQARSQTVQSNSKVDRSDSVKGSGSFTKSDILPVIDAENQGTLFNLDGNLGARRKRGKKHHPQKVQPQKPQPLQVQYTLHGTPSQDAAFWHQQSTSSSCAIVAQTSVYQSITGGVISEGVGIDFCTRKGWYDPSSGTLPKDMGNLLVSVNIPTYIRQTGSLGKLVAALDRGDKVIAAVDGNEIWHPLRNSQGQPLEQINAGHAVWVTGITTGTDGLIYQVTMNDSGQPQGRSSVVSGADFLNAWSDYNGVYIIADAPPYGTVGL